MIPLNPFEVRLIGADIRRQFHHHVLLMADSIEITNLSDGEVLTYSLVIIRGKVADESCTKIYANSSADDEDSNEFRVVDRQFIALYELKEGSNEILLSYTPELDATTTLNLFYSISSNTRRVRPTYLIASDGDGSFQSPDGNSSQESGIKRLRTAALLVQSSIAELMHEHGFKRRTFALTDDVYCHRMTDLPMSKVESYGMGDGMKIWQESYSSLAPTSTSGCINLAVMSFTRMVGGKIRAHTALGGGQLALFGGGSLFCWPETVSQVSACFLDSITKFDPKEYFDDSSHRMAKGGVRFVAATTLGAMLHELGHCLSLPHPAEGSKEDVMHRGFDYFDRLFVQPLKVESERPKFSRSSALRLRHHSFLQFDGEVAEMKKTMKSKEDGPSATPQATSSPEIDATYPAFYKQDDGRIVCVADAGIGHVVYYKNGDDAEHEELSGDRLFSSQLVLLSKEEVRIKCGAKDSDRIVISVIDLEGAISDANIDDL